MITVAEANLKFMHFLDGIRDCIATVNRLIDINTVVKPTLSIWVFFTCSPLYHASNQSLSTLTEPTLYNRIAADTTNFHCKLIDFDQDGNPDKVFWNKYTSGDSLYVFRNTGVGYECSLKTINFSADGIYEVDDVGEVVENGVHYLVITTHFNGAGGLKQSIYLNYNQQKQSWKITHSMFESTECFGTNDCYVKTCKVIQRLALTEKTRWNKYRDVTEARETECKLVKK